MRYDDISFVWGTWLQATICICYTCGFVVIVEIIVNTINFAVLGEGGEGGEEQ